MQPIWMQRRYTRMCMRARLGKKNMNNNKETIMPQISTFYGIIIFMNFQDHAPAHFHAWYGDYKIIVNITDGVVKGEMPGRALRMVLEWLDLHRDELLENWDRAQSGETVKHIVPLK